jgi:P4 family phage/plasmid primase-like protien
MNTNTDQSVEVEAFIAAVHARCRTNFRPENIPADLKILKGWVVWKAQPKKKSAPGAKFDKVPYYVAGGIRHGKQGSAADRSRLGTFEQAHEAFKQDHQYSGLGLAMLPDWGLVAFDGDECVSEAGEIDADVDAITEGTYTEVSPSGRGIRAFYQGSYPSGKMGPREVYSSNQFVTVTGVALDETRALRTVDEVRHLLDEMFAQPIAEVSRVPPALGHARRSQLLDDLRSALEVLDPEPYDVWLPVGMALKTTPLEPDVAAEIFHEWSARSDKYDPSECQAKWDGLKPSRTSYKAIFKRAQELGWVNPATGAEVIAGRTNNQDLLAELFAKRYEGALLYVHDFGAWLEFDGRRWLKDPVHKAFEYARQLCRVEGDGKQATRASFFSGVEQIAKCDPRLSCASSDFDRDNYLLNTPAGVYDLRTDEVSPHHPEQRLTKITAAAPTAAHGGVFLKAINEICAGDEGLVRFLQVSLGAILSGAREAHWLIYWFGTGRNGKNLLADLFFFVMGDYAHKLPASALMAKKYEAHPSELTGLRGVRLALSSEIEEGSFWNEARLKELTGDEFITARYMGKDAFTFTKSHKHLILGNHRPQIKTIDEAIKNRVLLVPFNVSFAGREDPDLPGKVRAEGGFVLHWLIEGHTAWLKNGKQLPKCEAVEQATQGYFAAQSTIEMWLDECCRKVEGSDRPAGGWHTASELYENYQQWKRARGEAPVSQTRFGESMTRKFDKAKSNRGLTYAGLELIRQGLSRAVIPMAA